MKATGKMIKVNRLAGPMVKIGTFRLIEDVALLEDGTSLKVTGVDVPLKTFLGAVINEGLMTVDEVNAWIDRKYKEQEQTNEDK